MLLELEAWLRTKNESAADSLREAFEELLTVHRLKVPTGVWGQVLQSHNFIHDILPASTRIPPSPACTHRSNLIHDVLPPPPASPLVPPGPMGSGLAITHCERYTPPPWHVHCGLNFQERSITSLTGAMLDRTLWRMTVIAPRF